MKKFYLLFISFFIRIYSIFKDNPIFLFEGGYPIVLSTEDKDNYYYVLTQFINIKIDKESGNPTDINNYTLSSSNSIYVADKSNNNYIVDELNNCFKINYNPFISFGIINLESINIEDQDNAKNLGITNRNEITKIGSIGLNYDFIIYGYYREELFFSSKSQQFHSSIRIHYLNDKLSCKYIEGEYFICAMIIKILL